MFSDISILSFLIYAAGVGFAAAIIYTNIQRTALSKFINYLIDNSRFDEQSAKNLDSINLSSIQKKVIKSAVKHQYGFKRSVKFVSNNVNSNNNDELFFDNTDTSFFYISDSDAEALRKKYSYKTMPTKLVILFVAALAIIVFVTSFFVTWLVETVTAPKVEDSNPNVIQTENVDINNEKEEVTQPDLPEDNSEDKPAGPRIPI